MGNLNLNLHTETCFWADLYIFFIQCPHNLMCMGIELNTLSICIWENKYICIDSCIILALDSFKFVIPMHTVWFLLNYWNPKNILYVNLNSNSRRFSLRLGRKAISGTPPGWPYKLADLQAAIYHLADLWAAIETSLARGKLILLL